jgi:hypothetical protein
MMKKYLLTALIVLLAIPGFCADELQRSDIQVFDKSTVPIINDELRKTSRRLREIGNAGVEQFEAATDDTVLIGNGSTFDSKALPASCTNPIVYTSSTNTFSCASVSAIETFTSDGTFTAPAGITKVYLTMVAGGGGGGTGVQTSFAGGGGGGGGSVVNYPYTVVPGNSYDVVVGAGGAGGAAPNSDGIVGSNSTFDSTVIVLGGNFGGTGASADGLGGAARTANASGATGGTYGNGSGSGSDADTGEPGSGSIIGAGADSPGSGNVGIAAAANSGGGGSGGGVNTGGRSGGAGGSGLVIVMY